MKKMIHLSILIIGSSVALAALPQKNNTSFETDASFSLQIIDVDSVNKEAIIEEILTIQKSLLIPLEETTMPSFAQTGFITIQRSPQYLLKFLEKGIIIVAYHQNQMVGYLSLEEIDGYIDWARGRRLDAERSLDSLDGVKYIDQVAALTTFANQEIETVLINLAKELSPYGIMTDTLAKPYPNLAAMALFRKNGFVNLGTLYVEETDALPQHQIELILWLPEKP